MYELFTEYLHNASGAQLTQSVFVETKIELISALPPTHLPNKKDKKTKDKTKKELISALPPTLKTFQSDDHIHVAPPLSF